MRTIQFWRKFVKIEDTTRNPQKHPSKDTKQKHPRQQQ